MILPDSSRFVIGLRPDGEPQSLYESPDGSAGFLAFDRNGVRLVEVHRLPDPDQLNHQLQSSLETRLTLAEPLRHPNLACVLERGEDEENGSWYATEFVEGERLRPYLERVAESNSLPQRLGLSLVLQLAEVIAFLAEHPRLLAGIQLEDFAVTLDRGRFLQLRLTDFGFDREENPVRDTELAARWIQTIALLLQHLFEGDAFPDPEVLEEAEQQHAISGPLGALVDALKRQPDTVAFRELKRLKTTLLHAADLMEKAGNRYREAEFRAITVMDHRPFGPLYHLLKESTEFEELVEDRWKIDTDSSSLQSVDGMSPFTLTGSTLQNSGDEDSSAVFLEILPPERLLGDGISSRIHSKMSHGWLRKHPCLTRTRSLHCEDDLTLIVNTGIDGFSLNTLKTHRPTLQPAEARHLAREFDQLLTRLEEAPDFDCGVPDPWRLLIQFDDIDDQPEGQLLSALKVLPITEWQGYALSLRLEPITESLVEPELSSWRYLRDVRMNGKSFATLTLWMLESERFDVALAEGTADSQPLSCDPGLNDLFMKAAEWLDESDPAQRKRFLEMFDERTRSQTGGEAASIVEPDVVHPAAMIRPSRRQRNIVSS